MVAEAHRAKALEQQAVAEVRLAEAEAQRAVAEARINDGMVQVQQSTLAAASDRNLNFEVKLDRAGNASIDGETISLDELRKHLAKLKDETSNAFSMQIIADPECPVKLFIPVLDVCSEVGDIDIRVASSNRSGTDPAEGDVGSQNCGNTAR
jgi:biopolymer transport protein ExbD